MTQTTFTRPLLALLCLVGSLTCFAQSSNWPQWRGPQGAGVSTEKNLPDERHRHWLVGWVHKESSFAWSQRLRRIAPVSTRQCIRGELPIDKLMKDRAVGKILAEHGLN